NALAKVFPQMLAKWEQPSPEIGSGANSIKEQVIGRVRVEITKHSGDLLALLPKAGIRVLTIASDVVYVVIVPILAFFILKDGRLIREHILEMVDEGPRRLLLDDVMADLHLLLAHYIRALLLLSLATFVSYSIFFAIMGVPYGILLATVAFLLEFIP